MLALVRVIHHSAASGHQVEFAGYLALRLTIAAFGSPERHFGHEVGLEVVHGGGEQIGFRLMKAEEEPVVTEGLYTVLPRVMQYCEVRPKKSLIACK